MKSNTLAPELLDKMDAYWRAANYLSVGQIYLYDNPLLKRSLILADVKHLLLGHWGTTPGQNFIYVHLNRVIKKYDLDMIYISGPGHGGPAVVANTYLEGTYSEIYPDISPDEAGLRKLFVQFSFPGGIPSHASPECPGSIHEGGELGYSLSHAFGAVFDNPEDRKSTRLNSSHSQISYAVFCLKNKTIKRPHLNTPLAANILSASAARQSPGFSIAPLVDSQPAKRRGPRDPQVARRSET